MENVNKKGKLRGKKFVWFERMLRREGRKLCAVALCASMIIGNMAWPAAAANDTSGEYSFELTSESLFDAIQDAIAEGTVMDTELDLKGSAADEYQSFLEAGSSLYEIEPVIDNDDSDRDKVLDLRAFVRLENDIELDSAYVMDGSEEITFLLVNSSDVYQQATISVDGRESETITVLPASAVAVDEEEAGPGVSGTANYSNTTVTGSGSGSGGSGGGGGSSTSAAGSTQIDESAADDNNTADIVIENAEINDNEEEQDSVVEVQPEAGSDEEEQEPEKEDGSAENQQDDADADGADEDESGTQDETGDVSEEEDKDDDPDAADEPGDSGMTDDSGTDPADEDDENGTDESGNDNTADDQNDESDEEADDEDEEAGSGETVVSAISVHATYLLAASATPSDAEEATPSDASSLNGEAYETILLDSEAVVAYVTNAEDLELNKIETILYTAELEDVVFSVEVPVGALPWGVELKASEYEKDSETYQSRYAETVNMIDELDEEEDHTEAIRLFNVGFYDTDGVEVEPTEKVNVTITYLDADADDVGRVVHFGEEGTEVIDVETDYDEDGNKNIAYELESFSDMAAVAISDDGISVVSISGDTTVAVGSSITLTSSYSGLSYRSHSWSSSDTSVATVNGNGYTASVTGVSAGTATITHTCEYTTWSWLEGYKTETYTETYTITVNKTTVYVFVAGYDYETGENFSQDMLDLLNVNTLDGSGYFAAGTLELDLSQLSGDTSSKITSKDEWEYVLSELAQNLNTSASTTCPNNKVAKYAQQVEIDTGVTQNQGYSGLWLATGHANITEVSGSAVGNQFWHLDIRFKTVTITYIYGKNGIDEATDPDAYDGNTAGTKVFIKGAEMDYTPTISVPEGWKIVGYYTTSDFQEGTEWDAVGQPIDKDTTVYIKIVPEDDVVLNYVVAEGDGTVTNPSNDNEAAQNGYENFNPTTGSPVGSTATAGVGYEFGGWYSDADCTQRVSDSWVDVNGKIIPQPDDGTWEENETHTYYAKFVPTKTSVTVNKVWDDNGSTLRPNSINIKLYADDVATATDEATITGTGDSWTYTFTNLPEYNYSYEGGPATTKIVYTAEEDAINGYTSNIVTGDDGTITVTNTLNMATVTLTKVVAGNMGVESEEFTFTVNYTDASGASRIATYTLTGETGSNTASFDVKLGTDVTVVEASKDLENSEVQHTISATVNNDAATVSDNTVTFTVNGDSEIVVTNTYSNNPGTGISLDSAPYIGILFGVLLFGAVAFIHRRRRML